MALQAATPWVPMLLLYSSRPTIPNSTKSTSPPRKCEENSQSKKSNYQFCLILNYSRIYFYAMLISFFIFDYKKDENLIQKNCKSSKIEFFNGFNL